MDNLADSIFDYMVSIVAELLFGRGNLSEVNINLVRLALLQMGVYKNIEAFVERR